LPPPHRPSFPTRRSSDLAHGPNKASQFPRASDHRHLRRFPFLDQTPEFPMQPILRPMGDKENLWGTPSAPIPQFQAQGMRPTRIDRKSTRLNSSHEWISY